MKLDSTGMLVPGAVRFVLAEPVVELHIRPGLSRSGATVEPGPAPPVMSIPLMDLEVEQEVPDGLVFHLPRSGSTLLARMLSARPQDVCLLEPLGINGLLSCCPLSNPHLQRWLGQLLSLYVATHRAPGGELFIKLSSWMTLYLDAFHASVPATPTLFLYRDPVEVLTQILDREPGWMAEHAKGFILDAGTPGSAPLTREGYCAAALARFCDAVLSASRHPLVVAYSELPGAALDRIAGWFGLELSPSERDRMLQIANADAKDPQRSFVSDSALWLERASQSIRELAERELAPRIDALRRIAAAPTAVGAIE
jgi:hypothetical protein